MSRFGGTLSELAERCSVSPSTVSRVLNNSKHGRFSVSPEVRQRILDTARDLNYRPSMAARNLTASKTHLVAVLGVAGIWSDRVGPVEEAVGSLTGVLDRAGYEICVQFLSKRHGPFDLPPLRVDGVVAVGPRVAADTEALDKLGVPYVVMNGLVGKLGSSVTPDDTRGTRLALKHLCDLGHRRIAYLDHWSMDANHPSVFERRQAFQDAAAEFGFDTPPLNLPLLPANTAWDSYYEPFVRSAIIDGGATAVLTYSHQGALALFRTAHDLGMIGPDDFSLVCFNNEPVVRLSVPSLTAVDVPSVRMGEMAAEILLRQMSSSVPVKPVRVRLDESLIVRESSGPPKRR
ncbi:MAG: LacI family DNA-binding transcriptional regulator [Tepidisphaeraceae bacterium]